MEKTLMILANTETLEDFEVLASHAKSIGATHVHISSLSPRSRWQWERDLSDPYCNWGMSHIHVFKLYVPEEMHSWLPWKEAQIHLAGLKAKYEILQKHDLKLSLGMNEPFWLPNEMFDAHPNWRGPRIDHPRRSRSLYYSPCIDDPEVLSMYRRAMSEICKEVPVDTIIFKSNDAGAGICWSTGLYSGRNGPSTCKNTDMKNRVLGFLNTLKDGAKDAGNDIILDFDANLGFKENERIIDTLWPLAPDNVFINGFDNKGRPGKRVVNNISATNQTPVSPVLDIPDVMRSAMNLCDAWKTDCARIVFGIPSTRMLETLIMLKRFVQNPANDYLSALSLVRETAVELVGENHAGMLTDLWLYIARAFNDIEHLHLPYATYGTVHQRWLTRPLVAFPERLEPEERDYYRRYQFQALTEDNANDLMDIQGLEFIRGFSGTFLATQSLGKAAENLQKAIKKADEILKSYNGEYECCLRGLTVRLKAAVCVVRNAINTAGFQEILDTVDHENPPVLQGRWPTPGDPRVVSLQNIIRAEIDNTQELILLLRGREHEILRLTKTKEEEDIFIIGPDIVEVLERKIQIMFHHSLEIQELFETGNI